MRTLVASGVNEYQSVFLYASDIAAGALFLWWLFCDGKKKSINLTLFLPLFLLLFWFFVSSIFSPNIFLGLYRTLKFAEFLWLFYYIRGAKFFQTVLSAILASAAFQSVLAIIQFTTQHSLGLWILGEERLSPVLAGVAKLDFHGQKIIRAYGTLPHPNVLATFLFLAFFIIIPPFSRPRKRRDNLDLALIPLLTLGLLLTFSRTVILLSVIAMVFLFFINRQKKQFAAFALSLCVFGIILAPYFFTRFSINPQEQAVDLRIFYTQNALASIRAHPLFGVGPGQFTSYQQAIITHEKLPQWANQPVHNIYLLLASEAGLPALLFFLWFLYNLFLHSKKPFIILCSSFLILGLFDHFFFSYQAGALLFWLTLALAGAMVQEKNYAKISS